jgi:hypothetical protein
LKARLGEMLLQHELLEQKITMLEGGRPCMGSIVSTAFHRRPPIIPIQERPIRGGALAHVEACQSDTSPYNLVFGGPMARTMMLHTHRERGSEGGTSLWFGLVPKGAQRCTTSSDEERRRRLGSATVKAGLRIRLS